DGINMKSDRGICAHYFIDFPGLVTIALVVRSEVGANFSSFRLGHDMKHGIARHEYSRVPKSDGCIDGKPASLPPAVGQRECSMPDCQAKVAETVPDKKPPISEPGIGMRSSHSFDNNFAVIRIGLFDSCCLRH